jgi:lipopolysaccharide transport system permease protein
MSSSRFKKTITLKAGEIDKEYLKDIFRFRELFIFFALRDITVRYRQAFFGIAWAILRPVLTMLVFFLIFGMVARVPTDGISYPIFFLAGMVPWQLFSNATMDACNCLLNNSQLITKAYFPRMIIPASQIMVHLVDYVVNMVFFAVLFMFSAEKVLYTMVFIPLFFFLLVTLCFGLGLWLSALTIRYRDFRIIVPFLMQFGMILSPVAYGTTMIPERFQYIYFLNPLVGIIEGTRWALFNVTYPLLGVSILYSVLISLFLLVTGFFYFRKMERTFADKL